MVSGWRRAFCTSMTVPKDREPKVLTEKHQEHQQHWDCDHNTNQSPQMSSESQSQPSLPCRTSVSNSSLPNSPNLHCNNATSPTPNKHNTHLSTPSSPNSPSSYYSLLKATLRLSKSLCGICTQCVRTGEGKAIFTAECSHTFHFPCIAAHVKRQQILTCPVCGTNWNDLLQLQPEKTAEENKAQDLKTTKSLKLPSYNDDEPLLSPTPVSRFNPIPESDENEEEEKDEENKEPIEFQGFNVSSSLKTRTFDAFLLPEAAIVASNRSFETMVAVLKVKAKPCNAVAHRPPVDLVTVLDVGGSVSGEELRMLKRSMHVVISSLGSADRLAVVAFSDSSKRLFPLRRMTGRGRRAARRVVDALAATEHGGEGTPARKDALRKAAKVLEDRRQRNPVAKIILLSNGHENRSLSSTRFSHLEIPVHVLNYTRQDGAFAERVGSLLRVVAQDLRLELQLAAAGGIAAVYSPGTGFTAAISPGSVVVGDIHAAEERELLVEIKLAAGTASRGSHNNVLSVRSSHRDPFTQELVHSKESAITVPRPRAVRSLDPKIQRLMRFHVSATNCLEENLELLTPMSAWKAAERLAKVAIMRKSMNKVSDLHGFENAGF